MEPWGTPHVIFVLSDLKVAIETKQSLAFKYDSNHFKTQTIFLISLIKHLSTICVCMNVIGDLNKGSTVVFLLTARGGT